MEDAKGRNMSAPSGVSIIGSDGLRTSRPGGNLSRGMKIAMIGSSHAAAHTGVTTFMVAQRGIPNVVGILLILVLCVVGADYTRYEVDDIAAVVLAETKVDILKNNTSREPALLTPHDREAREMGTRRRDARGGPRAHNRRLQSSTTVFCANFGSAAVPDGGAYVALSGPVTSVTATPSLAGCTSGATWAFCDSGVQANFQVCAQSATPDLVTAAVYARGPAVDATEIWMWTPSLYMSPTSHSTGTAALYDEYFGTGFGFRSWPTSATWRLVSAFGISSTVPTQILGHHCAQPASTWDRSYGHAQAKDFCPSGLRRRELGPVLCTAFATVVAEAGVELTIEVLGDLVVENLAASTAETVSLDSSSVLVRQGTNIIVAGAPDVADIGKVVGEVVDTAGEAQAKLAFQPSNAVGDYIRFTTAKGGRFVPHDVTIAARIGTRGAQMSLTTPVVLDATTTLGNFAAGITRSVSVIGDLAPPFGALDLTPV